MEVFCSRFCLYFKFPQQVANFVFCRFQSFVLNILLIPNSRRLLESRQSGQENIAARTHPLTAPEPSYGKGCPRLFERGTREKPCGHCQIVRLLYRNLTRTVGAKIFVKEGNRFLQIIQDRCNWSRFSPLEMPARDRPLSKNVRRTMLFDDDDPPPSVRIWFLCCLPFVLGPVPHSIFFSSA